VRKISQLSHLVFDSASSRAFRNTSKSTTSSASGAQIGNETRTRDPQLGKRTFWPIEIYYLTEKTRLKTRWHILKILWSSNKFATFCNSVHL